ncbi:MAG: META domain-containing protein, partial [Chloroflexota bacterium]
ALAVASSYMLDGDQLTITDGDGATLVFARQRSLAETSWQLETLGGAAVIEGTTITLNFNAGDGVSGSGGCNTYAGSYSADDAQISFSQVETTERACLAEGVMQQEQAFYQALTTATRFDLRDDSLTIRYGDGDALVFSRANS